MAASVILCRATMSCGLFTCPIALNAPSIAPGMASTAGRRTRIGSRSTSLSTRVDVSRVSCRLDMYCRAASIELAWHDDVERRAASRFAHGEAFVRAKLLAAGLSVVTSRRGVLRREANDPNLVMKLLGEQPLAAAFDGLDQRHERRWQASFGCRAFR